MKTAALISLLAVLACQSVDSDNVLTSGLYADLEATADGFGQTRLSTTLYLERPGSLDYIELEGDDTLIAYGPGGVSTQMIESQILGITRYGAVFESEDEGDEFIVELSRTIDDGAPDSRLVLPPPFALSIGQSSYSRATDEVTINWGPVEPGDDVDWAASGECVAFVSGTVEGDPGLVTIPIGTLVADATAEESTCEVSFTVTRSRPGVVDPAYGFGGQALARQIRTIAFTSAP